MPAGICFCTQPMRSLLLALALLLAAAARAQEPRLVNVIPFSNRAVNYVATHTTRNPGAFVIGTETPISRAGKWSIRKYGTTGCAPDAFACVAVLYTPPSKETVCEWTVQIAEDPSKDTIVALTPEAARFYLLRLSSEEALKLSSTQKQPPFLYPAFARSANLSGSLIVLLTLDPTGAVATVRTLTGPPLLRDTVEDTLKHWRFAPYRIHGQPLAAYAYAQIDTTHQQLTLHFLNSAPPRPPSK